VIEQWTDDHLGHSAPGGWRLPEPQITFGVLSPLTMREDE
jgi:hypothetical protein